MEEKCRSGLTSICPTTKYRTRCLRPRPPLAVSARSTLPGVHKEPKCPRASAAEPSREHLPFWNLLSLRPLCRGSTPGSLVRPSPSLRPPLPYADSPTSLLLPPFLTFAPSLSIWAKPGALGTWRAMATTQGAVHAPAQTTPEEARSAHSLLGTQRAAASRSSSLSSRVRPFPQAPGLKPREKEHFEQSELT